MCCESDQTCACGGIELVFLELELELAVAKLKPAALELELEPLVPEPARGAFFRNPL
jgi:hypothetical protein